MIAIPLALIIECDHEKVMTLQILQDSTAFRSTSYRIAEIGIQTFQDAGLQQKLLQRFGLSVKDFIAQIIQHVAVIPGEGSDKLRRVTLALQSQSCQLQPG